MAVELLLRPDRGNRAYRLRCRFRIGAFPQAAFLEKAKYAAAERFRADMAKQGWEYVDRFGFTMTGPYPAVEPLTLPKRRRVPSAREMLPAVAQGTRFLAPDLYGVQTLPMISESEHWEYELAAVFVHKTILMEMPDAHEEKEMMA